MTPHLKVDLGRVVHVKEIQIFVWANYFFVDVEMRLGNSDIYGPNPVIVSGFNPPSGENHVIQVLKPAPGDPQEWKGRYLLIKSLPSSSVKLGFGEIQVIERIA